MEQWIVLYHAKDESHLWVSLSPNFENAFISRKTFIRIIARINSRTSYEDYLHKFEDIERS